ncbi:MAG: bifunctional UDP-N-acetylglucosamine diphosphorylase/glucosamine-1-phosphate N-acetyltransferase GlmU [Pseudomonadota bacterium]
MTSANQSPPASSAPIAAIILGAGHGTRMQSTLPKVLHELAGLPLIGHAMACADHLDPAHMAVVIGGQAPIVGEIAQTMRKDLTIAVQAPPRGTGDAVKQALPMLENFEGTVLILYGDTPLMKPGTLRALAGEIDAGHAVSVLGFKPTTDHAYGRLITDNDGHLHAIVEARDAAPAQLAINFCNSGVMAVEASFLRRAIPTLKNDNAKGEYYLTDLVAMARADTRTATAIEADEAEVMGVDSRNDLALAEKIWQEHRRAQALDAGVTLHDPSTVYFSHDTKIGKDVTIGQHVVFGPGVTLEDGVTIEPFSHVAGAHLHTGVRAGPFARLRPGAHLGPDVKVGNFVEIKKATLARGAKVSHLSYIGDAHLGEDVNIGAGTITCNYDGFNKHETVIEDGAFVGSNTSLVAPVTIGKGAYVGSGSVVTKSVGSDALAIARTRQREITDWARKFRSKMK